MGLAHSVLRFAVGLCVLGVTVACSTLGSDERLFDVEQRRANSATIPFAAYLIAASCPESCRRRRSRATTFAKDGEPGFGSCCHVTQAVGDHSRRSRSDMRLPQAGVTRSARYPTITRCLSLRISPDCRARAPAGPWESRAARHQKARATCPRNPPRQCSDVARRWPCPLSVTAACSGSLRRSADPSPNQRGRNLTRQEGPTRPILPCAVEPLPRSGARRHTRQRSTAMRAADVKVGPR